MKVRIERHNYCVSSQRECKNFLIRGFAHPDLTHVHKVISEIAQVGGRIAGNS